MQETDGRASHRRRAYDARIIRAIDFEKCFNELDTADRMLLVHIHRDGVTQEEIAEMQGRSRRSVCYQYDDALDHLGDHLELRNLL